MPGARRSNLAVLALQGLLIALGVPTGAAACPCFPPEMRLKTGRDTLALASTAVFGRVEALDAAGVAQLRVTESFKGLARDSLLALPRNPAKCPDRAAPPPGLLLLVVAFADTATVCESYEQDHFLLEAFRANAARPGLAIAEPAAAPTR